MSSLQSDKSFSDSRARVSWDRWRMIIGWENESSKRWGAAGPGALPSAAEPGGKGRAWGASPQQPATVLLLQPQNMVPRQSDEYLCLASKKDKEGKENGENEEKMRYSSNSSQAPGLISVYVEEFILLYH